MWGKNNFLPSDRNIIAEKLEVNGLCQILLENVGFCLKEKFLLCFPRPNSYFIHLHSAGSLNNHVSIFSNKTFQNSLNSLRVTYSLRYRLGLFCVNNNEKAKCYLKMLPSMFWTSITEYLYLLNITEKKLFFGYCQDMIYFIFLQLWAIPDRKLVS